MPTHLGVPTRSICALAAALVLGGCAGFDPPAAFDKGELARRSMLLTPDPIEARFTEQIYTSKENASGGSGVGGGGCGCN